MVDRVTVKGSNTPMTLYTVSQNPGFYRVKKNVLCDQELSCNSFVPSRACVRFASCVHVLCGVSCHLAQDHSLPKGGPVPCLGAYILHHLLHKKIVRESREEVVTRDASICRTDASRNEVLMLVTLNAVLMLVGIMY